MNNIVDIIKNNNNFVILVHKNPDGDAVSSSLTLYNTLVKLGKDVDVVLEKDVPNKFNYLSGFSNIMSSSDKKYDIGIVVDTSLKDRINANDIVLNNIKDFVIIDHHISNSKYFNNYYIDGDSASCSMIIYEIIKLLDINMDKNIAECIVTGILTDTGGFRNNNTDKRVFEYVYELSDYVDINCVFNKCLGSISINEYKLKKITMDRLKFYFNNRIAYSYVLSSDLDDIGATKYECSSLVNIAREINDVEVSIFARLFSDCIRLSFRSKHIDVNKVISKFGGGGHKYASGLILDSINNYDEILNNIIKEIENEINEWDNSNK